jgi:hypothetical protein
MPPPSIGAPSQLRLAATVKIKSASLIGCQPEDAIYHRSTKCHVFPCLRKAKDHQSLTIFRSHQATALQAVDHGPNFRPHAAQREQVKVGRNNSLIGSVRRLAMKKAKRRQSAMFGLNRFDFLLHISGIAQQTAPWSL